ERKWPHIKEFLHRKVVKHWTRLSRKITESPFLERDKVQKKTFTKWINQHLMKVRKHVNDLYEDLRDGHNLISLLEVLSGDTLPREKGRMRFHRLQNVQIALDYLKRRQVKLVNIRNDDITDGNPKLTLGLIWTIILHFQISDIHVTGESEDMSAKERLLLWSQQTTEGYAGIRCENFTTCWRDGRLFNAIIHKYRPDLIDMNTVAVQSNLANLEHAFFVAEKLGVARLLDPEDVDVSSPDEKSVITYVSSLYDAFPKVPEGGEGISANDVEVKWVEYQNMVNYLMQWIRHHVTIMSDRTFPNNPVELKALYNQYLQFKETEIPPKETDKSKIKHLYKLLEVKFGRIKLSQGYHPNDIEKEWGKLIIAMLEREKTLRPEVERYASEDVAEAGPDIDNLGIPPRLIQSYVTGVDSGTLQTLKLMQIRKPLMKSAFVDQNLTEEEVNMKFVQDLLSWVEEMQVQLDRAEWGSDLPSVESHLENHKNVHKAIEEFESSLKEAKISEIQMTAPLKLSYAEKLHKLESQYSKLLNTSRNQERHLDTLHNFVSRATRELIWLNEKEEEEVAYDWSERNPNITRKKEYHAELMRELDEKEEVIKSVQEIAEQLLLENHPARLTIEAYRAAMQTQWSWILQLCHCVEQHLRENAAYFEFFSDAKEAMEYLKNLKDTIYRKYSCDRSSSLHRLEDLVQESMEEKEQLLQYKSTVAGLVGRAKAIIQLKPRNPDCVLKTSIPIKAICDYRQIEITIYKDDECVLANNSHRAKWKVISPSGNEAMVPSVCFTVPPPNKEAIDTANRIEQQFQNVLALWHESHVNMKSVVSWHYLTNEIEVVRAGNVASVSVMTRKGEHQQVLSNLQSRFDDFVEDSQESKIFTSADTAQLEREVNVCKQYYQELLKSAEREEQEESIYNLYISEVRNIRLRLESCEERLIRQIRTPMERDDVHENVLRISEQEVKFFSQAAGSPSVPTLRSELNVVIQNMNQVYSMSSIFIDKYVQMAVFHHTYEKRQTFHALEDELQKAKMISDQMFKMHKERDLDFDWHKEKVDQLAERWQNVHSQIENRLRDLEGINKSLKYYKDTYNSLDTWIQQVEDTQRKIQEIHPENSKALAKQLNQHKDYELQTMTYRAMVDSQQKSPVKRRRIQSSSDFIIQEFMDLRTRYTALVTLMTQYIKFAGDSLKRLEEEEVGPSLAVNQAKRTSRQTKSNIPEASARQAYSDLMAQQNSTADENKKLLGKVKTLEEMLESMKKQKIQVEQELPKVREAAEKERKKQQKEMEEICLQKTKAEQEAKQCRIDLESIEREKADAEQELECVKQFIFQAETQRSILEENLRAFRNQIEESVFARRNLEDLLRRKDTNLHDLEKQKNTLMQELKKKTDGEEKLMKLLKQMEQDLDFKGNLSEIKLQERETSESRRKVEGTYSVTRETCLPTFTAGQGSQCRIDSEITSFQKKLEAKKVEELKQKIDELTLAKKKADKTIKDLKYELNETELQKSSTEEKSRLLKEKLDQVNSELKCLKIKLEEKDQVEQGYLQQLKELDRQLQRATGKAEEVMQENMELKKLKINYQEDLKSVQQEKTQLKREIEELTRSHTKTEITIKHLNSQISSLQKEKLAAEHRTQSCKGEANNLQDQYKKIKEQLLQKTKVEKENQHEIQMLKNELTKSNQVSETLKKQIEDLNKWNTETKLLMKQIQSESEKMSLEKENIQRKNDALKALADGFKEQLRTTNEQLHKQTIIEQEFICKIKSLEVDLAKTKDLASDYKQKCDKQNASALSIDREVKNLNAQMNALTVEKRMSEQKMALQQAHIQELSSKLKKLQDELHQKTMDEQMARKKMILFQEESIKFKHSAEEFRKKVEKLLESHSITEKDISGIKLECVALQQEKHMAEENIMLYKRQMEDLQERLKKCHEQLQQGKQAEMDYHQKCRKLEEELEAQKRMVESLKQKMDRQIRESEHRFLSFQNEVQQNNKLQDSGFKLSCERRGNDFNYLSETAAKEFEQLPPRTSPLLRQKQERSGFKSDQIEENTLYVSADDTIPREVQFQMSSINQSLEDSSSQSFTEMFQGYKTSEGFRKEDFGKMSSFLGEEVLRTVDDATQLEYFTEEYDAIKFHGLRHDVTARQLTEVKLLDRLTVEQLISGQKTVDEVQKSLEKFLTKPTAIAGLYLESSKEILSFALAAKRKIMGKALALAFLEAQAATGFIIDPTTGQKFSVDDSVVRGLADSEFKSRLLEAEKAVLGYCYSGKVLSVFQAVEAQLLERQKGKNILEAQIACGGVIDPVRSVRVPPEAAVQLGLLNNTILKFLHEPSSNEKCFHNPNNRKAMYYCDLLKMCLFSVSSKCFLLPVGERKISSPSAEKSHKTSVINVETGSEMTSYEAYQKNYIDKATYLELSKQEFDWKESTCFDSDGNSFILLTDLKTGVQFNIEETLNQGRIDRALVNKYKEGLITVNEFGDILVSSSQPNKDLNSPIAGFWLSETNERIPVLKASRKNLVDRVTALRCLEAQVSTGGVIDPFTGKKYSVSEALQRELIDDGCAKQIQQCELIFTGIIHPVRNTVMSAVEAVHLSAIDKEMGMRCLEYQYLTGGLIDPKSHSRLTMEDAIKNGIIDAITATKMKDERLHNKVLTCPKTKKKITYKEALDRAVFDCHTGLRLLEAAQPMKTGISIIAGVIDQRTGEVLSVFQSILRGFLDYDTGIRLLENQLILSGIISPELGVCYDLEEAKVHALIDEQILLQLKELSNAKKLLSESSLANIPVVSALEQGLISEPLAVKILENQLSSGYLILPSTGEKLSLQNTFQRNLISPTLYSKLLERQDTCKDLIDPNCAEKISLEQMVHRSIIHEATGLRLLPVKPQEKGRIVLKCGRKVTILRAAHEGLIDRETMFRLLGAQVMSGGVIDPDSGKRMTVEEAMRQGMIDQDTACGILTRQVQTGGILCQNSGQRLTVDEAVQCNLISSTSALLVLEAQRGFVGLIWPHTGEIFPVSTSLHQDMITNELAFKILNDRKKIAALYIPETCEIISLDKAAESGIIDSNTVSVLTNVTLPDKMPNVEELKSLCKNAVKWLSTYEFLPSVFHGCEGEHEVSGTEDPVCHNLDEAKKLFMSYLMVNSYMDANTGQRLLLYDGQLQEVISMLLEGDSAGYNAGVSEMEFSKTYVSSKGIDLKSGDSVQGDLSGVENSCNNRKCNEFDDFGNYVSSQEDARVCRPDVCNTLGTEQSECTWEMQLTSPAELRNVESCTQNSMKRNELRGFFEVSEWTELCKHNNQQTNSGNTEGHLPNDSNTRLLSQTAKDEIFVGDSLDNENMNDKTLQNSLSSVNDLSDKETWRELERCTEYGPPIFQVDCSRMVLDNSKEDNFQRSLDSSVTADTEYRLPKELVSQCGVTPKFEDSRYDGQLLLEYAGPSLQDCLYIHGRPSQEDCADFHNKLCLEDSIDMHHRLSLDGGAVIHDRPPLGDSNSTAQRLTEEESDLIFHRLLPCDSSSDSSVEGGDGIPQLESNCLQHQCGEVASEEDSSQLDDGDDDDDAYETPPGDDDGSDVYDTPQIDDDDDSSDSSEGNEGFDTVHLGDDDTPEPELAGSSVPLGFLEERGGRITLRGETGFFQEFSANSGENVHVNVKGQPESITIASANAKTIEKIPEEREITGSFGEKEQELPVESEGTKEGGMSYLRNMYEADVQDRNEEVEMKAEGDPCEEESEGTQEGEDYEEDYDSYDDSDTDSDSEDEMDSFYSQHQCIGKGDQLLMSVEDVERSNENNQNIDDWCYSLGHKTGYTLQFQANHENGKLSPVICESMSNISEERCVGLSCTSEDARQQETEDEYGTCVKSERMPQDMAEPILSENTFHTEWVSRKSEENNETQFRVPDSQLLDATVKSDISVTAYLQQDTDDDQSSWTNLLLSECFTDSMNKDNNTMPMLDSNHGQREAETLVAEEKMLNYTEQLKESSFQMDNKFLTDTLYVSDNSSLRNPIHPVTSWKHGQIEIHTEIKNRVNIMEECGVTGLSNSPIQMENLGEIFDATVIKAASKEKVNVAQGFLDIQGARSDEFKRGDNISAPLKQHTTCIKEGGHSELSEFCFEDIERGGKGIPNEKDFLLNPGKVLSSECNTYSFPPPDTVTPKEISINKETERLNCQNTDSVLKDIPENKSSNDSEISPTKPGALGSIEDAKELGDGNEVQPTGRHTHTTDVSSAILSSMGTKLNYGAQNKHEMQKNTKGENVLVSDTSSLGNGFKKQMSMESLQKEMGPCKDFQVKEGISQSADVSDTLMEDLQNILQRKLKMGHVYCKQEGEPLSYSDTRTLLQNLLKVVRRTQPESEMSSGSNLKQISNAVRTALMVPTLCTEPKDSDAPSLPWPDCRSPDLLHDILKHESCKQKTADSDERKSETDMKTPVPKLASAELLDIFQLSLGNESTRKLEELINVLLRSSQVAGTTTEQEGKGKGDGLYSLSSTEQSELGSEIDEEKTLADNTTSTWKSDQEHGKTESLSKGFTEPVLKTEEAVMGDTPTSMVSNKNMCSVPCVSGIAWIFPSAGENN
uniref:Dystonin n=1 Tax=Serinus canaria TaxID=9135 RepID=A0A8C9N5D7_SERCA